MKNNHCHVPMAILAGMAVFCAACAELKGYCDQIADAVNDFPERLAGTSTPEDAGDAESQVQAVSQPSAAGAASETSGMQVAGAAAPGASSVQQPPAKRVPWKDSRSEEKWERCIQASERTSTGPRMAQADADRTDGLLEAFGTQYMPNAHARYREARAKAKELERKVSENFPRGPASDPTGGELYAKANKNLAVAVARMFRHQDELCFFLLLHQAGIFSDSVLAKSDARPISLDMIMDEEDWPDDTPKAVADLSPEDREFAARYAPKTLAACQKLASLHEEGVRQYRELRKTALELDAARARSLLIPLRMRLEEIGKRQEAIQKEVPALRLNHAMGEQDEAGLAAADQAAASDFQAFSKEIALNAYFLKRSIAGATKTIVLPGGATMEMVRCPPGSFVMGSPSDEEGRFADETQHLVTLTRGFWMAKHEVTLEQWESVMGSRPRSGNNDIPAGPLSWDNCQRFCRAAGHGLQLPTEAQWEYACRAGSTTALPNGDIRILGKNNAPELDGIAWYGGNSSVGWHMADEDGDDISEDEGVDTSDWDGKQYPGGLAGPHPVGQKAPNAWGLHDMLGNSWEWCEDWIGKYPNGDVEDPTGPEDGEERVLRGGSWFAPANAVRSAFRGSCPDDWGFLDFCPGFRPVIVDP